MRHFLTAGVSDHLDQVLDGSEELERESGIGRAHEGTGTSVVKPRPKHLFFHVTYLILGFDAIVEASKDHGADKGLECGRIVGVGSHGSQLDVPAVCISIVARHGFTQI